MKEQKKQEKKRKSSRVRTPDSSLSPYTKNILQRNEEIITRFEKQRKL